MMICLCGEIRKISTFQLKKKKCPHLELCHVHPANKQSSQPLHLYISMVMLFGVQGYCYYPVTGN